VLNLESWGVRLLPANWVNRLKSKPHSRFNPTEYVDIETISFYNSMCLIVKGHEPNSIGGRVVAGDIALVYKSLPKANSKITVPFQKKNVKKLKLK
jgi:hypothetical protein